MSRTSHTATGRSWSSVCTSAANDPRRGTIETQVTATDDTIRFDETGQFAFAINGQNCTASSRRTRSYRLIERAGDAPEEAPAPSAEELDERVLSAVLPSVSPCAAPGPLTKLTISPERALVQPGQDLKLELDGHDAKGCRVALGRPKLTLPS